jgi:hypothetical protein
LLERPTEDELDMLDHAPCTQATSRLGCQIKVTEAWAGTRVTIPAEFRNMCAPSPPPLFVPLLMLRLGRYHALQTSRGNVCK